jgi:hypothetical protein
VSVVVGSDGEFELVRDLEMLNIHADKRKERHTHPRDAIQIRSFVAMDLNLGRMRNSQVRETTVRRTFTRPRRTSERGSHARSSGNSPKSSNWPAFAFAQYASWDSFNFLAVLYLKKDNKYALKMKSSMQGSYWTHASRTAQILSMRLLP